VPRDALRNEISAHVARLLKEEREKRAISLNVLAQKSGLSRQTVSYVEQEAQSPSLDTLLRLTLALDVELADLIKRAKQAALAGE
jgi:transcriptional regulator with XRE-family HTH domain